MSKLNSENVKISSCDSDSSKAIKFRPMSPSTSTIQFAPNEDGVKIDPKVQMILSKMMEEKHIFNYKKLVVPMSMRSIYWKCYGFPASEEGEILTKVKIVCLICKTVIAYNRNTSNLRMHLQNKHPEELMQLELSAPPRKPPIDPKEKKMLKKNKANTHMYSTNADGTVVVDGDIQFVSDPNVTITSVEDYENNGEQKVRVLYKGVKSESSSQNVTLLVSEEEHDNTIEAHPYIVGGKSLCDAITEFIILDMQPPDIVDGRGFVRLIANLKSPCDIPNKNKFVEEAIPKVYDTFKESIQEHLLSIMSEVALTVEEWDSSSDETYVTFSIYYQQPDDDNLYSKVLSTLHCPPSADSSYWTLTLENFLEEWNLKLEKIKAVVTGTNKAEIVEALHLKGLTLIPCLVQTLQEVCTRTCFEQEDVREVLNKCRSLITLIFRHNNAITALRIQDHLMALEEIPLTADYPRVWISTYVMLENLLARRPVILSVLDNIEPTTYDRESINFTDQDWALVEDVITVLEPFKVTMMTLSEEKAPLISLLKPLLWQLVSSHLKVRPEDSVNAQMFKASLRHMLTEKYSESSVNLVLQIATTLDPRFKSLPNTVEEARSTLDGPIKSMLKALIEESPEEMRRVNGDEQPDRKKPRLSGMEFLLGELCATSSGMSSKDRADLEIVQYQSELTAPLDQCPLAWWHKTAAKCPHLSRLAAHYTCIPATATPPVRIPLDAQTQYDMKRANLTPEVVDKLIFLNGNYVA